MSGGAKQLLARVVLIRYGVVFLGVAWKSGGGRFSNVLQIVRGFGWRDFWCPWGAFVPLSEHITLQYVITVKKAAFRFFNVACALGARETDCQKN